MSKDIPTFGTDAILWAQSTLFQTLLVKLMSDKTISVESAEGVFDLALERAKKARNMPDAERVIQHMHDNMDWDIYYRWSAGQKKDKD